MTATAIFRRKTGSFHDICFDGDELDERPIYLKEFPRANSILKDLTLGVLLGRQYYLIDVYVPYSAHCRIAGPGGSEE